MSDSSRRTGPAIEAHFQFILWLTQTVDKFPRSQRFILGDRIQTTALDVLEDLIEATYTRDRRGHLARANLGIEKMRYFCRIAVELHYLDKRRYEYAHTTRHLTVEKFIWRWTSGTNSENQDDSF